MTELEVDRPETVREVRTAFDAYEEALLANDVDALDGWFWQDPRTTRFGIAEQQHGYDAIAAWRRTAPPVPADRRHERVDITTFGSDFAVVTCEFRNGDATALGRQTQVWVRGPNGWRITSAHVSSVEE